MNITITGQGGFLGSHLKNHINCFHDEIKLNQFKTSFFDDNKKLVSIIKKSDVIVHLAGVNRASSDKHVYTKNIELSNKLINAIDMADFKGKLIFASSIQEELNNHYGKSKYESRQYFEKESERLGFQFISLILPNIYGPFCRPYYNSFIATFCHNLINDKQISIINDNEMPLIYVENVVKIILDSSRSSENKKVVVKEDINIKVSNVYSLLKNFKDDYIKNGIIPEIDTKFKLNLFNTFRSYLYDSEFFPRKFNKNMDQRGIFSEIIRAKGKGQFSYSVTKPDEVRGNHFHTKRIERFSIIKGEAIVEIRKIGSNEKKSYYMTDKEQSYIDIPIWHTHNLKNVGKKNLLMTFWINEFYNEKDSDTFYQIV